mmetsp:Transcript_38499/g.39183  ORF Transcript_38499/g.39183 Transcript_38499/m.39183 type:complete len:398 (-) Transcript_38499:147-1340(-)
MPNKGGKRKNTRTHLIAAPPEGAQIDDEAKEKVPKSIVVKVGKVTINLKELVREFRRLMEPNTAANLRERSFNKIKDYSSVAGLLGVSHLLIFTQTKKNIILRICRYPNGPTVHFKIEEYCLCRHIRQLQKRPYDSSVAFLTPPLIVLNNFGAPSKETEKDNSHIKLIGVTLQHMFPSINVKTVQLNECRRVILFHYKRDTERIEMRHYAIRANPVGISRSVKKVLQTKMPNLGNLHDISEYLDNYMHAGSDSEADEEASKVVLPDRFVGRGNSASQQSALRLIELGPRLNMTAFKVERGVAEGEIIYNKFITKTPAEIQATKTRIERERVLKETRKKIQEDNIAKKRERKEEKQKEREERKRRRLEGGEKESESESESEGESEGEFNGKRERERKI